MTGMRHVTRILDRNKKNFTWIIQTRMANCFQFFHFEFNSFFRVKPKKKKSLDWTRFDSVIVFLRCLDSFVVHSILFNCVLHWRLLPLVHYGEFHRKCKRMNELEREKIEHERKKKNLRDGTKNCINKWVKSKQLNIVTKWARAQMHTRSANIQTSTAITTTTTMTLFHSYHSLCIDSLSLILPIAIYCLICSLN